MEASFGNYSLTQISQSKKEEKTEKKTEIEDRYRDNEDHHYVNQEDYDDEKDHHGDEEEDEEEEDDDDIVPDPDTFVEYDVDSTGGTEVGSEIKTKTFSILGKSRRRIKFKSQK